MIAQAVDIFAKVTPVVISAAVGFVALQQWKNSRRATGIAATDLQHKLFDRRFEVYREALDLSEKLAKQVDLVDSATWRVVTDVYHKGRMLFGDDVRHELEKTLELCTELRLLDNRHRRALGDGDEAELDEVGRLAQSFRSQLVATRFRLLEAMVQETALNHDW